MNITYTRRLLWHGILLFLLGLIVGFAVPALHNPRMGLASHLEGVMNGTFLLALGLAWRHLILSARSQTALFWLALYGTYVNWFTTLLAATFGTSRSTPLAGAGYSGAAWQEALVDFGLVSLSLAMLGTCVLALWGLRGSAADPAN
jgi:hydroxylaminobenzene mutase